MKYLIYIMLLLPSFAFAQERLDLKEYGINATIDSKGMELNKWNGDLKSDNAQKVLQLEFDFLQKLNIIWLKPNFKASKILNETLIDAKKKGAKIHAQEKNAFIMEGKGGIFRCFCAVELKGNQYFMQSGVFSSLDKASKILEIAKSMQ